MSADKPFDRRLRRLRRDRAARQFAAACYGHHTIADELIERLDLVKRDFHDALDLGCADGYLTNRLRERGTTVTTADHGKLFAEAMQGVLCDEDRLPFADASFDLIVSLGVLDTVNDLPGALVLIRRALRPDGLFLAALAGAGSLPQLKSALLAADQAEGAAAPHIHPQIDVRAAGDLLTRAGFALPVADSHPIDVRFPGLDHLVADLRAAGATNLLGARSLGRQGLAAAHADFAARSDWDGKVSERFEVIFLIGWAPGPGQPQPARRGSAAVSLASALKSAR